MQQCPFVPPMPEAAAWFEDDGPGHWRLDLWLANKSQLVAAGLASVDVHAAKFCTADHPDECDSYRRDGAGAGRMTAAVGGVGR